MDPACDIGVHCYTVVPIIPGRARHCGFTVESSLPFFTPPFPVWLGAFPNDSNCLKFKTAQGDGEQPFGTREGRKTSFNLSVCQCLKDYAKLWNRLPKCSGYDKNNYNSNFALRCIAAACGIPITWKGSPPTGWDCTNPACLPSGEPSPSPVRTTCPCAGGVTVPGGRYPPPTGF